MERFTVMTVFILFSLMPAAMPQSTARNPVLEYCTGTWCQWCPCGHSIIKNTIVPNLANAVIIGYHGPANSANDPYSTFSGNQIISALGLSSYPTAVIDRTGPPMSRSAWFSALGFQNNQPATVEIRFNKAYNSATRQLQCELMVTPLTDLSGYYRINLILLEDGLKYSQTGNSSCAGGTEYTHDHVVRAMINGYLGDTLNRADTWKTGNRIIVPVTYTVPAQFIEDNCNLAALVYKVNSPLNSGGIQQAMQWALKGTIADAGQRNTSPGTYRLGQNYPNPFNPETTIPYYLPAESRVTITLYDLLGNAVKTLLQETRPAGEHTLTFTADGLSGGTYFYRMEAGGFSAGQKLILLK